VENESFRKEIKQDSIQKFLVIKVWTSFFFETFEDREKFKVIQDFSALANCPVKALSGHYTNRQDSEISRFLPKVSHFLKFHEISWRTDEVQKKAFQAAEVSYSSGLVYNFICNVLNQYTSCITGRSPGVKSLSSLRSNLLCGGKRPVKVF